MNCVNVEWFYYCEIKKKDKILRYFLLFIKINKGFVVLRVVKSYFNIKDVKNSNIIIILI